MGKKNKRLPQPPQEGGNPAPPSVLTPGDDGDITPQGKTIIIGGVAAILTGFVVLTMADPMGRNWASLAAPFLILGGYGVVALGIFAKP